MSRASAAVRFESDGRVMVTLYNGTVDTLFGRLLDTTDTGEAWDTLYTMYRNGAHMDLFPQCSCGGLEPVEIAADYGRGFSWRGRACRRCLSVAGPLAPFDGDEEGESIERASGLPRWWPKTQKEAAE